jgi:HSP20 family molecular chaperone IbpA
VHSGMGEVAVFAGDDGRLPPSATFRTTLPTAVDSQAITASLHEGVLTVKVSKAEQAKPRRVEITAG